LGIPFLNATSTSPTLVQRGFRWFFRTTPDDETFAQNFFTFLDDLPERLKLEVPKQVILVYENQLWGTNVARTERKLSVKNGYQLLEDIPYDARAIDLSEELRRIKMVPPAIILQASYADDAILLMQGYKGFRIDPTAILAMDSGFIAPCFLERLGPDAEYVLSREVWALDLGIRKPLVKKINDLFVKRFGRNMSGNSARAVTCFITLADAIHRAASPDAESIRKALLTTDISEDALIMPWDGVRFDPDTGQNILGSGIIVQVQEGEYKTVWPWNLSSAPLIWPMPPWSERKAPK
jgi:branched-chain amino acid transport system substrate-binding protein